jgi:CelD/BcsL family acetyltransferase involved in cellulose biosynthesis
MSGSMSGATGRSTWPRDGVVLVRDLEGLEALRDDWLRLEGLQDDRQPLFFQSQVWIAHVARVRADADAGFSVLVAVGLQTGRVSLVWPLALIRRGGMRVVTMLDDPFGQFAGVLAAPGSDVAVFVRDVTAALQGLADGMRIAQVFEGSSLSDALASVGARVSASQETVSVELAGYDGFRSFQLKTGSKSRKVLRNYLNRLEGRFTLSVLSGHDEASVNDALGFAFDERRAWMKRHGRYSGAFHSSAFRTILEGACRSGVSCLGFRLLAGTSVVSAQWGFVHRNRYYGYMSALNPAFEGFSAGRLHLGMVIEDCFARGLAGLELMPPASRYKLEWNGTIRRLDTFSLALTLRGWLVFTMLDGILPRLRRLSRMLPERIRTPLVNLLNPS